MTVAAFFGCAFTAFGPALAMFVLTIAHDPVRVIILILSAFFWLLSLLLSSLLWFAVVPLKDTLAFGLVFSVLFQETFRVLIYLLLRKADAFMKKITENEDTHIFDNRHILSYVVGLGFGMMSGAFSMVNVLADSIGPGTIGLMDNTPKDFFMVSAVLCLCMILLNTCWGVIAFDALDKKKVAKPNLCLGVTFGGVMLDASQPKAINSYICWYCCSSSLDSNYNDHIKLFCSRGKKISTNRLPDSIFESVSSNN